MEKTADGDWFVYILQSEANGYLYTGVAVDPSKRLETHNAGKGARFTRANRPWKIVHLEKKPTRGEALRREYAIKQLSRAQKLAIIVG